MLSTLIRTIIIYLILIISMRILGKRQMGELEPSELVTTILLSEIASLPLTEPDIPIMFAVVPIVTLLSLEVISSVILIKFPSLKNLLSPRPNVLIEKGKLNQKELRRLRITVDELFSELRASGITDISDVCYAILEENGKLSVIPYAKSSPPTAEQLKVKLKEPGISHILISDGKINRHGLRTLGLTKDQITKYVASKMHTLADVFLLVSDDLGKYTLILKE